MLGLWPERTTVIVGKRRAAIVWQMAPVFVLLHQYKKFKYLISFAPDFS
nr:hypothetical protein SYMBAF_110178 [Serratia symbiotica]